MKSFRRSRTAGVHGVWKRVVGTGKGSSRTRGVVLLLLTAIVCCCVVVLLRHSPAVTTTTGTTTTLPPSVEMVRGSRATVETPPPVVHKTHDGSTPTKNKEQPHTTTTSGGATKRNIPGTDKPSTPNTEAPMSTTTTGKIEETSRTTTSVAPHDVGKSNGGAEETTRTDNNKEAYSTTCHLPRNLPTNPRTGSTPFNIALTTMPLSYDYLLRMFTTVDTFCIADHEGVPMLANANTTTGTSPPHAVYPSGYDYPCGQEGDRYHRGPPLQSDNSNNNQNDDDEIPTTTTYIPKHERWARELAKARRPTTSSSGVGLVESSGTDGGGVPPKERFGIPKEVRHQALVTSSSSPPINSDSSTTTTYVYLGAARWASARHETIAYSQVVIGYVSVRTSTHIQVSSGGGMKKRKNETFSSQWHPLGMLPAAMNPTNTHRLASFIMANFRHDVFAPRAGIEDVIVIEAWGRIFVLGNVGFSLGHSQPFLGEITSRTLHSVKTTESTTNTSSHLQETKDDNIGNLGVLSYENEWLPMVDDPLSFGVRTGQVVRNNPYHAEKNWNAFPCYWNKSRVGGETPSFIFGDNTRQQQQFSSSTSTSSSSGRVQSTILCLQRNIAPIVETFAYDLRRRRVVQRWTTSKPHGFSQSARGGKGLLPVTVAARSQSTLSSSKNKNQLTPSSTGMAQKPPSFVRARVVSDGYPTNSIIHLLSLVHNVRAHYELGWMLQRSDSPFDVVVSASNNINGGTVSSPFSLYRYHYSLLGKPSQKLEEIDDEEKRKKSQQGRFRRPIEIKPTSKPKLIEFVKSISTLGEDGILFSHTVEDDSSIMCVASLQAVMADLPLNI